MSCKQEIYCKWDIGKKSALAKQQMQFLLQEAAFGYARTAAFAERSGCLCMQDPQA